MAIGNMHRKIGKDRACVSGDILADRQTDRHTQTCSSRYFATAAAGEVKIINQSNKCSADKHVAIPTHSSLRNPK